MIAKRFSISSAEVLFRKNYEMFRHETSMRNSFFSKATSSSTKKEFLHILFPRKFRKMSRKKQKLSEKLLTGRFDEYFHRYVLKVGKTYL